MVRLFTVISFYYLLLVLFSLHSIFLLLKNTVHDNLINSLTNHVSEHKHLKYPQKNSTLSRDQVKHQDAISITNGNTLAEGTDVPDEDYDQGQSTVVPEQQSQNCENNEDPNSSREESKDEKNSSLKTEADKESCNDKQENGSEPGEEKNNEKCEGEEDGKQKLCKQSNGTDEEGNRAEFCADEISCNQLDSGKSANQSNEPKVIKMNNGMDQHTEEGTHTDHQTDAEGAEPIPEVCENLQVWHYSSSLTLCFFISFILTCLTVE